MDINKRILQLLKEGYTQGEIRVFLIEEGIKPNSLSIIEKRLKAIREMYGAKTMFHLAIILMEDDTFIFHDDDDDDLTIPNVKDS